VTNIYLQTPTYTCRLIFKAQWIPHIPTTLPLKRTTFGWRVSSCSSLEQLAGIA
jgi:hypothetical protein